MFREFRGLGGLGAKGVGSSQARGFSVGRLIPQASWCSNPQVSSWPEISANRGP